ncbi:ribonuclease E/G [Chelativorans sp. YIM 93263]|uniref:ribonuclease E/G n=1 Tax=Chelativorans sp. YIM 93263 TaxID=2906648 RepID=UPI002379AA13|nr:ribonuclease E/G [Chelativorans sp. YIM 93263]
MPNNKMLIDASHPEETRVVVLRGNRIEEFDFESQDKKQLRGNIYLARVTRVEPSLQAAFVEYGGNRHGFLAFSEIHPDYYQIPVADRQAILQAEAEEAKAEDDAEAAEAQSTTRDKKRRRGVRRGEKTGQSNSPDTDSNTAEAAQAEAVAGDTVAQDISSPSNGSEVSNGAEDAGEVDTVGAEDALDEAQTRRRPVRRNYKIQEVIKRRQILLVQVVKEERGNKGAALTTYLSLAGRYSVLMPNTARGGGISRKITNPQDRKRLKEVVKDLKVPDGMGVILRTAGANRTKAEVKRDYDYLMRLWERVRNLTLQSIAPTLVYEEGSLIKRSVRDLYNKEIDEVLVSGEEGYREAKDFMRMLMPSHAKVVQPYRDTVPIFARNGIEAQLDRMVQPQVTLKSGGYVIINQTEALVAIDVNSGRSTKEHSIEDTALQTNLEAAEEVARQLRLRDLAGLIVIDFIDMDENRNNRAVEKRLKECLKNDRARIQVGRISHFGLLEMSRQRIRASVLESTMQPCPHCGGTGHVRSESSVALLVVRAIEEYLLKDARNDIVVRTPSSTALYLLNHKRSNLVELEKRFGVTITIETDEELGGQHYAIMKGALASGIAEVEVDSVPDQSTTELEEVDTASDAPNETEASASDENGGSPGRKRRRKRRRRGGRDRNGAEATSAEQEQPPDNVEETEEQPEKAEASESGERKKRHRGKRGGKRHRRDETAGEEQTQEQTQPQAAEEPAETEPSTESSELEPVAAAPEQSTNTMAQSSEEEEPKKKTRRRSRSTKSKAANGEAVTDEASFVEPGSEGEEEVTTSASPANESPAPEASEEPKKKRRTRRSKATEEPVGEEASTKPKQEQESEASSSEGDENEGKPRRRGWWQRRSFF